MKFCTVSLMNLYWKHSSNEFTNYLPPLTTAVMNPLIERRDTTRLTFETEVVLLDQRQKKIIGKILNLSASGALIALDEDLTIGKKYAVSIKLQGDTSNLFIEDLVATVVRNEPCCVAVKFSAPMEWLTIFYIYKQKLKVFKGGAEITAEQ